MTGSLGRGYLFMGEYIELEELDTQTIFRSGLSKQNRIVPFVNDKQFALFIMSKS